MNIFNTLFWQWPYHNRSLISSTLFSGEVKLGTMKVYTALVLPLVAAQALSLSPKIVEVSGFQPLRSYNRSTLYQVKADGSDYASAPYLLHLIGGRYGERQTVYYTTHIRGYGVVRPHNGAVWLVARFKKKRTCVPCFLVYPVCKREQLLWKKMQAKRKKSK